MAPASCKASCEGFRESTARYNGQFHKTKLCTFWLQNKCERNDDCKYAHGEQELKHPPNLSKTTSCANTVAFGFCDVDDCPYAHSCSELRCTQDFYKTKMCSLHKRGKCTMGSECRHAHSLDELHANRCSTAGSQTLNGMQCHKEPAVERQNPASSGTDIQLCTSRLQNKSTCNDDCKYPHTEQELKHPPNQVETTLCVNSVVFGFCNVKDCPCPHSCSKPRCAQGVYKTTMCSLHKRGKCTMGSECRHAHSVYELHVNKCALTLNGMQRHKKPAVERQDGASSSADMWTNRVDKQISCKGTQTEMTWLVPENEMVQGPSSPSSIPDKSLKRTLLCHGLPGNVTGRSDETDGFHSMVNAPRSESTCRDGTLGAVPSGSADVACAWTISV